MDFQFNEIEKSFQHEVREFFRNELPADWMIGQLHADEEVDTDEEWAVSLSMRRKMAEKNWLAWWWPEEYGGEGRSRIEYTILREEIGYYGVPGFDNIGLPIVAPTLLFNGSEDQKKKHLPLLASGAVTWCEGFSEPDAGSDLASLTTRAVEHGGFFVVNGQKCWTTAGHHADWAICLFRTAPEAPKHKGISMFMVDLKTPGVSRTPVRNLLGNIGWCDTYFDDVEVPPQNMIGEQNQGWYVAANTLNYERNGITWLGVSRRSFDRLLKYVRERDPLTKNLLIKHKLAQLAIEIEVARLFCYRVPWLQDKGLNPSHESSLAKEFVGDVSIRVAEAGFKITGMHGLLTRGSKHAPYKGTITGAFLSYPSWSLAAGSPEIQKNIIATLGLGLPRLGRLPACK